MAVKILNGIDVEGSMNIVASDVPNLDASKITSGTFSTDRIPSLSGIYQPIGNYLTSVPSEYLTQTEGDARYLRTYDGLQSSHVTGALGYTPYQEGTDLSAYTVTFANIEKTNVNLDGEMGWDANDTDAPATLGTYGSSYPDGLYLRGSGTLYTVYHTGHFTGTHIANWQTAYGWGNHASVGYLTSLPSHNHDTLYDSIGSADAVNLRIDQEVFPAISSITLASLGYTGATNANYITNNNQLTNGAGYATTSYVNTAVSNLVASAPAALNTLNELAAALGDDANFSTTIANNIGAVNTRIDTEVLPAIDAKQNAGNYFTDGDTVLNMANNDGLVYDDTTNKMYVKLDGTNREIYHTGNTSFLSTGGGTLTGATTIQTTGGAMLTLKDTNSVGDAATPYINFVDSANTRQGYIGIGSGSSAKLYLEGLDGIQANNPLTVSGSVTATGGNSSNWNTAYGWGNHASAGYLTSIPSTYATDAEVNTAVSAVNSRIDTEVLPSIPTNNNQLTNGAGYLTSVPSSFTTGNVTVTGYIKGSGQQLVLSAGEAQNYATGQTAEYIYMNAEQGIEVNSETGNWSGGWAARKTAYLRGDQLTLDGESLTKTNIQNFKTAYGWGDHGAVGYATEVWVGEQNYASDAAISAAIATVTLASLGYTGATNANYITNNNQLTNGAGYLTTSGKAADSNLLDGLDLGGTRANVANKVVRTDGNGYTNFGWINTTSGNTTGYLTDVYVNTNDGYIRKATPAHFRSQITDGSYDSIGSAAAVNTALSEEIGNLSTAVSTNTTDVATNRTAITTNATNISALSTSISTGSVTIGSGVTLSESTDRADLLMIKSSTSTWGGLQISNTSNEIIFSMMGDGNIMGLYDDVNSDWIIQRDENGSMRFYANSSNTVTVTTSGLSVTGAITASGDITAFSDARVKENVETLPNALESVKKMRGVTYNKIGEEKQSVGVIAQELEEVVPQLVHTDEEGMKSVAYGNITAVLIEALKEQQAQIEELKARLDGLTK